MQCCLSGFLLINANHNLRIRQIFLNRILKKIFFLFFKYSGDGTVFEFLDGVKQSGIFSPQQIPIAVIPTGSENALAAGSNFETALLTTLAVVNRWTIPMDALHIEWGYPNETSVSCLSMCGVGWFVE